MKLIVTLAAMLVPGIAQAQSAQLSNPEPTMNMPNYSTFESSATGREPVSDTPALQRQKVRQALALREEAAALSKADGGTLTRRHQAYLQRKAQAILTGRR